MRSLVLVLTFLATTAVARADSGGKSVVVTHGIEIELPAGWAAKEGGHTLLAPTKYKGRAIEVITINKIPLATKESVQDMLSVDKSGGYNIDKVAVEDRQGVKMLLVHGSVTVAKNPPLDLDMVILPTGPSSAAVMMSFLRTDQDPLLRKANEDVMLSARVAGPKLKVVSTKTAKVAQPTPPEFQTYLGTIAAAFDGMLILPRPLPIKFEDCGVVNAFYSPGEHSIRICHEFWDDTLKLFKRAGLDDAKAADRTRGTVMFAFFHEFGHALAGELGLPITGKGEDSADEIATLILSAIGPKGHEAALAGAEWFQIMAADPKHKNIFWDEHSFDSQRVISITCLLYGSDPARYEPLMTKLGVPKQRLAKCSRDYKARYQAWDQLLEPYHRKKQSK